MGVVRLPAKEDYWKQEPDFWPAHPVLGGMPHHRFKCMWRTIHLSETEEVDAEEPELDDDNEEEEEEEEVIDDTDEERDVDTRWYSKCAMIVESFVETSQKLCTHLGKTLSIDEMMKKFKGRSAQTHKMKNKPIKQGYKFFSVCDSSSGYIWNIARIQIQWIARRACGCEC